jgi:HEPN domain-containing protein
MGLSSLEACYYFGPTDCGASGQVIELKVKTIFETLDVLTQISSLVGAKGNNFFPELHEVHKDDLRERLRSLRDVLADARMTLCVKAVDRLQQVIDATSESNQIAHAIVEVRRRVIDQVESEFYLCLTEEEKSLYTPTQFLFGDKVETAFPELSEDIVESAKCLALHRYTASVFHLMRAMEGAVQALSQKLNIPNASREWGKLLSDIKPKIEDMPKGNIRNEWSENFSLLYHVKQAWRNETMHPKQTYTEEEAKEVWAAVRSFIRNLASLV